MSKQGERLKKIRFVLKLTQQQLADKLGVKSQAVSKVEKNLNGLRNESLIILFKKYNVNLNWLITGQGEMFNSHEKDSDLDKKIEQKIAEAMKNIQK